MNHQIICNELADPKGDEKCYVHYIFTTISQQIFKWWDVIGYYG